MLVTISDWGKKGGVFTLEYRVNTSPLLLFQHIGLLVE